MLDKIAEHSQHNLSYISYFIVQTLNGYVFNKGLPIIFNKYKSHQKKAFIIFCFFVLILNIAGYMQAKNTNLYEIMELNRTFTEQELAQSYKQKTKLGQKYRIAYEFLKLKNYREHYDKEMDLDIRRFNDGINIQLIFKISIWYFMHLLILLSQMKEEGDNKAKK